ncbi:hypothetical protein KCU93_g8593, partial [Aureobasidium melanogenum]
MAPTSPASGQETKRLRFDNEQQYEGPRAATDYAVKVIYATQGLNKGKREYLDTVPKDTQSNIVWKQMLPGFQVFVGKEKWSYDDLKKLASTPSKDLATFRKAGVYILIARDPITGECMIYVGSTGCFLVRFESHITEVMKGLAGKHYEPKKFYKWCVQHKVVPECVIALIDDTEDNEPHFNEFAEACIMSMLDAFTDETCHYGGQTFHSRAARSGELPDNVPWEGGNACWPVMMPHSTSWPGVQEFEEKQCQDCDFTCYKDKTLAAHMKLEHQKNKYACSFCDMSFSDAQDARDHTAEVHPGAYQCPHPDCDKSFSRQRNLTAHICTHTRPYVCEVCGRDFPQSRDLNIHMRTHSDDIEIQKPWKCRVDGCDTRFSRKHHMIDHEKTCGKTGDEAKPHKCSTCPKGFGTKRELDQHAKTCGKTGDEAKTYKCSKCGKGYGRKHHMTDHEKTCGKTGDEAKPHKCSKCGKGFGTKSDLNKHAKRCGKTGDEAKPPGDKAKPPGEKAKPHKCSKCGKGFGTKGELDQHAKTCGKTGDEAKTYKCSKCGKGYGRKHHMTDHEKTCGKTGDEAKPHKCSKCGEGFSRKSSATKHEKNCKKTGDKSKPHEAEGS